MIRFRFVVALLAVLGVFSANVSAQQFQEGVHYEVIEPAQPTSAKDQVEVVEVFGYMCPHCASFQPYVHPWSENVADNVYFTRIPAIFNRSWEPFARAYYAAEVLGVLDDGHKALFDAVHTERKMIRSPDHLADFFSQYGVDSAEFKKTMNSFAVETKLRRGQALIPRYGVNATPSMVVNGKYRTTGRMSGSFSNMLEVVDFLVAKEAAGLPKPASPAGEAEQSTTETGE